MERCQSTFQRSCQAASLESEHGATSLKTTSHLRLNRKYILIPLENVEMEGGSQHLPSTKPFLACTSQQSCSNPFRDNIVDLRFRDMRIAFQNGSSCFRSGTDDHRHESDPAHDQSGQFIRDYVLPSPVFKLVREICKL